MRRIYKIFGIASVLLLLLLSTVCGQEQLITGKLISKDKAVEYGYLINTRSNETVVSLSDGCFAMKVLKGDTLIFRCLGYNDAVFYISPMLLADESIVLEVSSIDYSLKEVHIMGFSSYAAFKEAFAALKLNANDSVMKFKVDIDNREILKNRYFANKPQDRGLNFIVLQASAFGV
jgi:hypothetical protein